MKLPGATDAVVDISKLRDYCLDPFHPRGRHKARVFEATLGLTQADADFLRDALLQAARDALRRGQVGTIVERLARGVYEVEFSDDEGRTYASLPLRSDQLLELHHEPSHRAA